ncbi:putative ribonuclease H-like domain-containing protein [Tanacetum coccineum]
MDLESAQNNVVAKLPLLKQENGNSFKPVTRTTTNADGTSTSITPGPVTTDQYKDAKTLFKAIQARFGGNDAKKKTQKTLLNQLAILGENISQEDLNLKFLRNLPSEWNTHVVVWRNKPDLDTMSFDDLYNNFKIVEQEVKRSTTTSSSSGSQNMAFVSTPGSTNEVDTANIQVSTVSTPVSTIITNDHTANLMTTSITEYESKKVLPENCFMADEEVPTNMALMAFLDSEVLNDKTCSNTCLKSFETLKTQYDNLRIEFNKSEFDLATYKRGIVTVEEQLVFYKKNEKEKLKKEKESNQIKIDNFKNASKSLDKLIGSQIIDKSRKGVGFESYNAVAPPPTGLFAPPTIDLSNSGLKEFQQPEFEGYGVKVNKSVCESSSNEIKKTSDAPIIEEWVSDSDEDESEVMVSDNVQHKPEQAKQPRKITVLTKSGIVPISTARQSSSRAAAPVSAARPINTAAPKPFGDPQVALKDTWIFNSGCSRHMTENKSYLTDYQDYDGGFIAFAGSSKGGKITGKSVSQMCDKKHSVLFTETECLILSPDFKLPDKNQVMLKIPRKYNMYSFDLKNVVPSKGLTCLFAKATNDESKLWHRRLGHINFKTMNKLVKGNLVRGLPSKIFENDHTCVACHKGKQHKSTSKKDETSRILKDFITRIENQLNHKVKIIRCDNGTEFKNYKMNQFCGIKEIKREFSNARTPQQNGVAERKNRTLIEAARTMLADSLLPIPFWAEAVNTACYVQNRVLVTKPHNKTPYELLIGKFDEKADEGFLVGYSINSKAFRVFNSRTRKVEKNMHVNFLENKPNVAGNRPEWLFDIDTLTNTMNYQPVSAGNRTNSNAGLETNSDAGQAGKKKVPDQEYILLPLLHTSSNVPSSSEETESSPKDDAGKKNGVKDLAKEGDMNGPGEATNTNNTNRLNTVSSPVNTDNNNAYRVFTPVNAATPFNVDYLIDHLMPDLEDTANLQDTGIFGNAYDDEDVGAEDDINNLETTMSVSPIPTTRIHKDHPKDQIIGEVHSAVQTRRMIKQSEAGLITFINKQRRTNHKDFLNCLFACFLSQMEPKKFCGIKRIKREFSNARTPQKNGVAERKNKTLIEAARTMLANSLLAKKDETSGILKDFITGIENQLNHKVKIIRCDNGTEFKNYEMNQLCGIKGIKREFSNARTPQQNGVAERKNRTLIEAARTMLADSLLPIPFWAEAVNTACYVQNRVLVTKPHNKTPYELLIGRTPIISFMRPFGCPVTILNTLNLLGNGPEWLFDIDTLTNTMNYQPVSAGNRTNGNAGLETNSDAGQAGKEKETESSPKDDAGKKNGVKDLAKEGDMNGPGEATNTNNTNRLNTDDNNAYRVFTPVNAATPFNADYPIDPLMPDLEDTTNL